MADPRDPLKPYRRRFPRRPAAALPVLAALAAAMSCAELNLVRPGDVVSVRVTPETLFLHIGDTASLRALALDGSDAMLAQRTPLWSSSAAGVATVSGTGLVSAAGGGQTIITALVDGMPGTALVVSSGAPASVALTAGDAQTAGVNEYVAIAPTVRVTDAGGHPVPRAAITFTVTGGGGSVDATAPVLTDADGVASTGWRLGPNSGANGMTATVDGAAVAGNPIAFAATAEVGPPDATVSGIAALPSVIPPSSGNAPSTITVTVRDAQGRTVSGATVVLAATGSGNSLVQPAAPTDANGQASGMLSSTVAETKTVTAVVNGTVALVDAVTVTVETGAPAALAVVTQPAGAVSNAVFATQPVVDIVDGFGNRLLSSNAPVTVSLAHGDGVIVSGSGSLTVNAVNGRATFAALRIRGTQTTVDTIGIGPHVLEFSSGALTPLRSDTVHVDISLAYNVEFVFANRGCTACHGFAYTFANMVNAPATFGPCAGQSRVVPGDSTSMMYLKVKTLTPACGGPMPGATLMSPRLQRILRDWILQGAKNN